MQKSNNANIPDTAECSIKKQLEDFRSGNRAAFNFIARYYMPKLKAAAYYRLRSGMDADDVLQETLIQAYRNLESFRGNALLSTWLCRILVNQTNSHYRKQKRLNTMLDYYKSSIAPGKSSPDPAAEYESADLCCAICRKIGELPQPSRMVILLWLRGMNYQDIAHLHRCSAGTVRSQLSRARKRLAKLLAGDPTLDELLKKYSACNTPKPESK